jgi:hypothetical protein
MGKGVSMSNKPSRLWLDQHGQFFFARTIKEAHIAAGGGKISKVYIDTKDGRTKHIGYCIGDRWFRCFVPWEGDQPKRIY